jgi:hypothetical protein
VRSLSRGGYYAWLGRPESGRDRADAEPTLIITKIHADHQGRLGIGRLAVELAKLGRHHSHKRVRRLARAAGLTCVHPRPYRVPRSTTRPTATPRAKAPRPQTRDKVITAHGGITTHDTPKINYGPECLHLGSPDAYPDERAVRGFRYHRIRTCPAVQNSEEPVISLRNASFQARDRDHQSRQNRDLDHSQKM